MLEEEAKRKQATHLRASQHGKDHSTAVLSLFKTRKCWCCSIPAFRMTMLILDIDTAAFHSSQGTSSSHDTASDDFLHPENSNAPSPAVQRLQTGIQSLKYQHSALIQSLYAHPEQGPSLRNSPLLAVAKEEEELQSQSPAFSTYSKASTRSNRLSSQSESSVWYDATEYEGAEEFVLDESPADESQGSKFSELSVGSPGVLSTAPTTETELDSSTPWDSALDTDDEDDEQASAPLAPQAAAPDAPQPIVRRTQLPSPPVGDEGSLFTVLKKNVGKVCTLESRGNIDA